MREENRFQKYSGFRPTGFDAKGLGADRLGIGDWLVMPVSQTRDSDLLTEVNFREFLAGLGGESDQVEVHRFGHWGPGWFEVILVDPAAESILTEAEEMADALESYPILNEEAYSEAECEAVWEQWENASLSDRIEYCAEAGISKLAARHEETPERVFDLLRDKVLRGC